MVRLFGGMEYKTLPAFNITFRELLRYLYGRLTRMKFIHGLTV
jgi:hypothetical protein